MNTRTRVAAPTAVAVAALATFATLALAACGSAPGKDISITVQITGSRMTPAKLTAHQNDKVILSIAADKKEEIHLHGYDYKFEMEPGRTQTKTFTADKTGSFEIEIEDTSTHLGELDVFPS
ncbi:MAG: cupredoxin domain-containing protein [Candidatus Dormibacteraeota bacterium]|nr:cupredoxin domain-containing protein [Candidatus Dormibacteraeota bacterium]